MRTKNARLHFPKDRDMKIFSTFLIVMLALTAVATAQDAATPAPVQDLDDAFQRIAAYALGQDSAPMEYLIERVTAVQQDPSARAELAQRLAALMSTDATFDCKRFVIRQLQVIGTEEQVPALAPLLTDPELSHLARYALERIPGNAVDRALLDALMEAEGKVKMGLINTLAARRNSAHVAVLASLLSDPDPGVAYAAAAGMGVIGGPEAAARIDAALSTGDTALRPVLVDALLKCADGFLAAGQIDKALAIYQKLYDTAEERHLRLAAFRGLTEAKGADALPLVLEALASDDPAWQTYAMACVRTLPGQEATAAFAAELDRMPPPVAALLITALAARGDNAALPAVAQRLESDAEEVRMAALDAVARLGDATVLPVLAERATTGGLEEKRLARASLYALRGEGIDKAILTLLGESETPLRVELIRALAERQSKAAVPILLNEADKEEDSVRQEALRAIGLLAARSDLPQLLDKLIQAPSNKERRDCTGAVVTVLRRIDPTENPVQEVLAAMTATEDAAAKAALLQVLGELADPTGLDVIRASVQGPEGPLQDAAVDVLADWPHADVVPELVALAKTTTNPKHRNAALRGCIRLVRAKKDGLAREAVDFYEEALGLAGSNAIKRRILAGLSEVKDRRALELAERCRADDSVADEAAVAAEQIRRNFYTATASSNSEHAKDAFDDKIDSRWDTGEFQQPGQWFLLDLSSEAALQGLFLDTSPSVNDYPRGYEVYVFTDPATPGAPVASGQGDQPVVEITFEPKQGRYIKIVQTGEAPQYHWSIHELRVTPK